MCYPSAPESGTAPEDDDSSEGTEEDPNVIEDSDAWKKNTKTMLSLQPSIAGELMMILLKQGVKP
jgi:hypothetical protein